MTAADRPRTETLEVPGARLTYDVQHVTSTEPILFLIASPMAAAGFGTLARHFTDRTVVTYDPARRRQRADRRRSDANRARRRRRIGSSRSSGADRSTCSRPAEVR